MTPCLRGAFLGSAIETQRAALPGSITTVRMLEREYDRHLCECEACVASEMQRAYEEQCAAELQEHYEREQRIAWLAEEEDAANACECHGDPFCPRGGGYL